MNGLRQYQAALMRALAEPDEDVSWVDVQGRGPSAAERVQVYRRSVENRLLDTMAQDFPRVKALLGEQAFASVVAGYLRQHPPSDPALRNLGARFADYLATEWKGPRRGLAHELARLEWKWSDVFDAPDEPVLTRQDLSQVPAEQWASLRMRPVAAHFVGGFGYSVHAFDLNEPDRIPPQKPVRILMWRYQMRVFIRTLEVEEAITLEALRKGMTFAEVCSVSAHLDETVQERAARVVGHLQRWIDDGLIAALNDEVGSLRR